MITRRQLLASTASTPLVSLMGTPALAASGTDHKALVCVFLFGGNDGFNTLIPNDKSHYDAYVSAREAISIPQEDLLPLTIHTEKDNLTLGLHPSMSGLATLINEGKAVPIANCGVLIEPATKQELKEGTKAMPPFLFSHNSQQTEWQRGHAGSNTTLGWVGRMMDILNDGATAPLTQVSPSFSIDGYVQLLNGEESQANLIKAGSLPKINAFASGRSQIEEAYHAMVDGSQGGLFGAAFNRIKGEATDVRDALATVLEDYPDDGMFDNNNRLSAQLSMVSRLIRGHQDLGQQRQVFFVGLGGFDTHANQTDDHQVLLGTLSSALSEFNESLTAHGISDNVTTMTMSDFGRRLASNGSGTDHGWGSNHFILGGAVNGGKLYGDWPSLILDGDDDFNKGRMIPTTSIEQIGAPIAKWMGVSNESAMDYVFPNLRNFSGTLDDMLS